MDAGVLGRVSLELGAGRQKKTDKINHSVGFSEIRKCGEEINRGDVLLTIHAPSEDAADRALNSLSNAIKITG